MARKVQVLLIDDLDGGEAAETVTFSLDGATYEIDLSGVNAKKLRESVHPFIDKARKAGRSNQRGPAPSRGVPSRERSASIRTWAKSRGIEINERGRIPASVAEQYDAAH